jgi:hypothetical protein
VPSDLKSGEPQPAGTLRACPALNRDCFTEYLTVNNTAFKVSLFAERYIQYNPQKNYSNTAKAEKNDSRRHLSKDSMKEE